MPKPCSPKSKFANHPDYECNEETGFYRLKSGRKTIISGASDDAPLAPKRAKSSYMIWLHDYGNYKRLKAEHPETKGKDLMVLAGQEWKQLPEEEKNKYTEASAQGKAQHAEQMSAYVEQHGPLYKKIIAVPKAQRLPTGKIGTRGYNLFDKAVRTNIKALNAHLPAWQIAGKISEAWKALSDQDRDDFNNQADMINMGSSEIQDE